MADLICSAERAARYQEGAPWTIDVCVLPAGHDGVHRSPNGTEWFVPSPFRAPSVLESPFPKDPPPAPLLNPQPPPLAAIVRAYVATRPACYCGLPATQVQGRFLYLCDVHVSEPASARDVDGAAELRVLLTALQREPR